MDIVMNEITVKNHILRYIFLKAKYVYSDDIYGDDIPEFLERITMDVSKIEASDSEVMNIIDLAISSAKSK